jgi:Cu/Ag efflux protein CusF
MSILPFLSALLLPALLPAADSARHGGGGDRAPAAATAEQPKAHPVKGVVVDVLADRSALLVKHEEVPGVMRAMTMLFKVEPEVLDRVKKGDAIQGLMSRRDDGWWLHAVEVLPAG